MEDKHDLTRLSRLTAILIMLQSKRIITAAEMAERFDVSKRTIYRDVKALEQAGVPVYNEEGKGYALMEGYTLPPIMFTEEEANALITAAKLISRNKDESLVKNHQNAITKVKAVLRFSGKEKADLLGERVAFFKNRGKEKTSNSLSKVQLAITNFQVLKINYFSINKKEQTLRLVEPLALYHTQENWILIAWCRLRKDTRQFRLDKFKKLETLDERFEPRDFDLLKYFKQF